MYVHLHLARKLMGWAFVLLAMVPSALCFRTLDDCAWTCRTSPAG